MTMRWDTLWKWFVSLSWVIVIFAVTLPGTWWYEIHDLRVTQGTVSNPPKVWIDRTIHRPFVGAWINTLLVDGREDNYTKIQLGCVGSFPVDLDPQRVLDNPFSLKEMMGPTCVLEPGFYKISVIVQVDPAWFPRKEVRFRSESFEILED